MRIQYLGTGAAEGVPALFCVCDHCRYARAHGGREIRGRSGALIDGVLKIDFGPDSFKQMVDNGIDYTPLRAVLVTHSHADHLCSQDLGYRKAGFAKLAEDDVPLTIYGNAKVGEKLEPHMCPGLKFQEIHAFEAFEVEGYTVTPLEAVHCVQRDGDQHQHPVKARGKELFRSEAAMIYLIERDGKRILYAHDTDEFAETTYAYLAGKGIDLISLDCTNGRLNSEYVGHMGAQGNLRMREKLMENGAADGHTLFVANHFSHNGLVPYEALEALLPGFIVTYDGMICEF